MSISKDEIKLLYEKLKGTELAERLASLGITAESLEAENLERSGLGNLLTAGKQVHSYASFHLPEGFDLKNATTEELILATIDKQYQDYSKVFEQVRQATGIHVYLEARDQFVTTPMGTLSSRTYGTVKGGAYVLGSGGKNASFSLPLEIAPGFKAQGGSLVTGISNLFMAGLMHDSAFDIVGSHGTVPFRLADYATGIKLGQAVMSYQTISQMAATRLALSTASPISFRGVSLGIGDRRATINRKPAELRDVLHRTGKEIYADSMLGRQAEIFELYKRLREGRFRGSVVEIARAFEEIANPTRVLNERILKEGQSIGAISPYILSFDILGHLVKGKTKDGHFLSMFGEDSVPAHYAGILTYSSRDIEQIARVLGLEAVGQLSKVVQGSKIGWTPSLGADPLSGRIIGKGGSSKIFDSATQVGYTSATDAYQDLMPVYIPSWVRTAEDYNHFMRQTITKRAAIGSALAKIKGAPPNIGDSAEDTVFVTGASEMASSKGLRYLPERISPDRVVFQDQFVETVYNELSGRQTISEQASHVLEKLSEFMDGSKLKKHRSASINNAITTLMMSLNPVNIGDPIRLNTDPKKPYILGWIGQQSHQLDDGITPAMANRQLLAMAPDASGLTSSHFAGFVGDFDRSDTAFKMALLDIDKTAMKVISTIQNPHMVGLKGGVANMKVSVPVHILGMKNRSLNVEVFGSGSVKGLGGVTFEQVISPLSLMFKEGMNIFKSQGDRVGAERFARGFLGSLRSRGFTISAIGGFAPLKTSPGIHRSTPGAGSFLQSGPGDNNFDEVIALGMGNFDNLDDSRTLFAFSADRRYTKNKLPIEIEEGIYDDLERLGQSTTNQDAASLLGRASHYIAESSNVATMISIQVNQPGFGKLSTAPKTISSVQAMMILDELGGRGSVILRGKDKDFRLDPKDRMLSIAEFFDVDKDKAALASTILKEYLGIDLGAHSSLAEEVLASPKSLVDISLEEIDPFENSDFGPIPKDMISDEVIEKSIYGWRGQADAIGMSVKPGEIPNIPGISVNIDSQEIVQSLRRKMDKSILAPRVREMLIKTGRFVKFDKELGDILLEEDLDYYSSKISNLVMNAYEQFGATNIEKNIHETIAKNTFGLEESGGERIIASTSPSYLPAKMKVFVPQHPKIGSSMGQFGYYVKQTTGEVFEDTGTRNIRSTLKALHPDQIINQLLRRAIAVVSSLSKEGYKDDGIKYKDKYGKSKDIVSLAGLSVSDIQRDFDAEKDKATLEIAGHIIEKKGGKFTYPRLSLGHIFTENKIMATDLHTAIISGLILNPGANGIEDSLWGLNRPPGGTTDMMGQFFNSHAAYMQNLSDVLEKSFNTGLQELHVSATQGTGLMAVHAYSASVFSKVAEHLRPDKIAGPDDLIDIKNIDIDFVEKTFGGALDDVASMSVDVDTLKVTLGANIKRKLMKELGISDEDEMFRRLKNRDFKQILGLQLLRRDPVTSTGSISPLTGQLSDNGIPGTMRISRYFQKNVFLGDTDGDFNIPISRMIAAILNMDSNNSYVRAVKAAVGGIQYIGQPSKGNEVFEALEAIDQIKGAAIRPYRRTMKAILDMEQEEAEAISSLWVRMGSATDLVDVELFPGGPIVTVSREYSEFLRQVKEGWKTTMLPGLHMSGAGQAAEMQNMLSMGVNQANVGIMRRYTQKILAGLSDVLVYGNKDPKVEDMVYLVRSFVQTFTGAMTESMIGAKHRTIPVMAELASLMRLGMNGYKVTPLSLNQTQLEKVTKIIDDVFYGEDSKLSTLLSAYTVEAGNVVAYDAHGKVSSGSAVLSNNILQERNILSRGADRLFKLFENRNPRQRINILSGIISSFSALDELSPNVTLSGIKRLKQVHGTTKELVKSENATALKQLLLVMGTYDIEAEKGRLRIGVSDLERVLSTADTVLMQQEFRKTINVLALVSNNLQQAKLTPDDLLGTVIDRIQADYPDLPIERVYVQASKEFIDHVSGNIDYIRGLSPNRRDLFFSERSFINDIYTKKILSISTIHPQGSTGVMARFDEGSFLHGLKAGDFENLVNESFDELMDMVAPDPAKKASLINELVSREGVPLDQISARKKSSYAIASILTAAIHSDKFNLISEHGNIVFNSLPNIGRPDAEEMSSVINRMIDSDPTITGSGIDVTELKRNIQTAIDNETIIDSKTGRPVSQARKNPIEFSELSKVVDSNINNMLKSTGRTVGSNFIGDRDQFTRQIIAENISKVRDRIESTGIKDDPFIRDIVSVVARTRDDLTKEGPSNWVPINQEELSRVVSADDYDALLIRGTKSLREFSQYIPSVITEDNERILLENVEGADKINVQKYITSHNEAANELTARLKEVARRTVGQDMAGDENVMASIMTDGDGYFVQALRPIDDSEAVSDRALIAIKEEFGPMGMVDDDGRFFHGKTDFDKYLENLVAGDAEKIFNLSKLKSNLETGGIGRQLYRKIARSKGLAGALIIGTLGTIASAMSSQPARAAVPEFASSSIARAISNIPTMGVSDDLAEAGAIGLSISQPGVLPSSFRGPNTRTGSMDQTAIGSMGLNPPSRPPADRTTVRIAIGQEKGGGAAYHINTRGGSLSTNRDEALHLTQTLTSSGLSPHGNIKFTESTSPYFRSRRVMEGFSDVY